MENYGTGYRRGYWQCKKKVAIAPDITAGKTQYIGAMVLIHYSGGRAPSSGFSDWPAQQKTTKKNSCH
jgi:hypothetical protein